MRDIVRRSTVVLALAAVFFTSMAQAMEIHQFDNLAFEDQGDYIQLLVDSAQNILIDANATLPRRWVSFSRKLCLAIRCPWD